MIWPRWRNWQLTLAASFAIFSIVGLGLALAWRSADQERLEEGRRANCLAIEALKKQLRPVPFDLENTRQILVDINVDPDSDTGKRLIETSRKNNARERKQLAPKEC